MPQYYQCIPLSTESGIVQYGRRLPPLTSAQTPDALSSNIYQCVQRIDIGDLDC